MNSQEVNKLFFQYLFAYLLPFKIYAISDIGKVQR